VLALISWKVRGRVFIDTIFQELMQRMRAIVCHGSERENSKRKKNCMSREFLKRKIESGA